MSQQLVLANASHGGPNARLRQAVQRFESSLTKDDQKNFQSVQKTAAKNAPTIEDVMQLTAEVNIQFQAKTRNGHPLGTRVNNILESAQQFAALGDILVGGSQNLIACGVWTVVRFTLQSLAGFSKYVDEASSLFMLVGRSAPRFQDLALLYRRSWRLQTYISEFFFEVVELCSTVFKFSGKSRLGKIAASLSDSDLKQHQTRLETWADQISREVEVLRTQTIEVEAAENSSFRQLISRESRHRSRMKEKQRVLDAFSTFDFKAPWKKTRVKGNASRFVEWPEWQEWVGSSQSSSFVITGILGCGKSVLLANIKERLDVLRLGQLAYFFCQHDLSESLEPKTIIGSISRQLLRPLLDVIAWDAAERKLQAIDTIADEEEMLGLIDEVAESAKQLLPSFVILDGLDECTESTKKAVVAWIGRLQKVLPTMVCISVRQDHRQVMQFITESLASPMVKNMSVDNEEIQDFINSELEGRLESGQLTLSDPSLIAEIYDALSQGAKGMFLWTSLLLGEICSAGTDREIRQALKNIPGDLSELFSLILARSSATKNGTSYQARILRVLVAQYRPLSTVEMGEALSIQIGESTWSTENQVHSVPNALESCGSLIMVHEEDQTVAFIHHSVRQFLLGEFGTAMKTQFTAAEANLELSSLILTYLNQHSSQPNSRSVSTDVMPAIEVGQVPSAIAQAAVERALPSSSAKSMALRLLRLKRSGQHDMRAAVASASDWFGPTVRKASSAFLPYAKSFCIRHCRDIPRNTRLSESVCRLWSRVPNNEHIDYKVPVNPRQPAAQDVGQILGYPRNSAPGFVKQLFWMVHQSQTGLLSHYLHGPQGLRYLASLVLLLDRIVGYGFTLTELSSDMIQLLTATTDLAVSSTALLASSFFCDKHDPSYNFGFIDSTGHETLYKCGPWKEGMIIHGRTYASPDRPKGRSPRLLVWFAQAYGFRMRLVPVVGVTHLSQAILPTLPWMSWKVSLLSSTLNTMRFLRVVDVDSQLLSLGWEFLAEFPTVRTDDLLIAHYISLMCRRGTSQVVLSAETVFSPCRALKWIDLAIETTNLSFSNPLHSFAAFQLPCSDVEALDDRLLRVASLAQRKVLSYVETVYLLAALDGNAKVRDIIIDYFSSLVIHIFFRENIGLPPVPHGSIVLSDLSSVTEPAGNLGFQEEFAQQLAWNSPFVCPKDDAKYIFSGFVWTQCSAFIQSFLIAAYLHSAAAPPTSLLSLVQAARDEAMRRFMDSSNRNDLLAVHSALLSVCRGEFYLDPFHLHFDPEFGGDVPYEAVEGLEALRKATTPRSWLEIPPADEANLVETLPTEISAVELALWHCTGLSIHPSTTGYEWRVSPCPRKLDSSNGRHCQCLNGLDCCSTQIIAKYSQRRIHQPQWLISTSGYAVEERPEIRLPYHYVAICFVALVLDHLQGPGKHHLRDIAEGPGWDIFTVPRIARFNDVISRVFRLVRPRNRTLRLDHGDEVKSDTFHTWDRTCAILESTYDQVLGHLEFERDSERMQTARAHGWNTLCMIIALRRDSPHPDPTSYSRHIAVNFMIMMNNRAVPSRFEMLTNLRAVFMDTTISQTSPIPPPVIQVLLSQQDVHSLMWGIPEDDEHGRQLGEWFDRHSWSFAEHEINRLYDAVSTYRRSWLEFFPSRIEVSRVEAPGGDGRDQDGDDDPVIDLTSLDSAN